MSVTIPMNQPYTFRLRKDLYCVEWTLNSTVPYHYTFVNKLQVSVLICVCLQSSVICIVRQRILFATHTVKPVFFACPLFRKFRDPDEFAKITGREYSNIFIC